MSKGIFGDLFDFNHDGELDTFERAMEFEAFGEMMKDDEEDDVDQDEELETELELAGLDAEELSWMDEDERREVLEDAGLDPYDYDF